MTPDELLAKIADNIGLPFPCDEPPPAYSQIRDWRCVEIERQRLAEARELFRPFFERIESEFIKQFLRVAINDH